jgi:hypothetical protein
MVQPPSAVDIAWPETTGLPSRKRALPFRRIHDGFMESISVIIRDDSRHHRHCCRNRH